MDCQGCAEESSGRVAGRARPCCSSGCGPTHATRSCHRPAPAWFRGLSLSPQESKSCMETGRTGFRSQLRHLAALSGWALPGRPLHTHPQTLPTPGRGCPSSLHLFEPAQPTGEASQKPVRAGGRATLRCAPRSCSGDPQKNRALLTPIPAPFPAEHSTPKPNRTKHNFIMPAD